MGTAVKILFYCNSIFSIGGVQRVLAVIAKSLATCHDVTILTLDSPEKEDKRFYDLHEAPLRFEYIKYPVLPFYEFYPCKTYSFLYKKILPKNKRTSSWYALSSFPPTHRKLLINKINEGKYDIVIGVHAFLSLHLATVQKDIASKTVGWMHNSYQAFFENRPSYLEGLKEYFKYQMPRLDKLIVLSYADRQLYRQYLNLSPTVVYNPLTVLPQGKGSPEYKKFLAVGRFSYAHKGFDILIKAFALFAVRNKEWTLDIVGEGPEENKLRELIKENEMEKRITLHPFTHTIQEYYASSSVYVLSSRWEGFGLVLIEAMSHYLPVISSDLPVAKEILTEGKNAIFFTTGDPEDLAKRMSEIVNDKDIVEMGENAYAHSQKFAIKNIMKQWQQIFSEL